MNAPRPLLAVCLVLSACLSACGGTVVFEEDGGEGGGGGVGTSGGIASASVAVGTSAGITATGSGGGSSSANASSATSSVAASVTVGQGGSSSGCASHAVYTECLGDGACVPLFDDACCSTCFPGECADCVSYEFVGCADRLPPRPEGACVAPSCGFAPDWACAGVNPECEASCFGQPGCIQKQKCQGDACELFCEPVRPDACGPASCNAPPPICFDGEVPEVGAGCWTGACVPAWVCAVQPPL